MRNGRAMTLCYNKRGIDAILDLTLYPICIQHLTPMPRFEI